jgi:hypothetical protein
VRSARRMSLNTAGLPGRRATKSLRTARSVSEPSPLQPPFAARLAANQGWGLGRGSRSVVRGLASTKRAARSRVRGFADRTGGSQRSGVDFAAPAAVDRVHGRGGCDNRRSRGVAQPGSALPWANTIRFSRLFAFNDFLTFPTIRGICFRSKQIPRQVNTIRFCDSFATVPGVIRAPAFSRLRHGAGVALGILLTAGLPASLYPKALSACGHAALRPRLNRSGQSTCVRAATPAFVAAGHALKEYVGDVLNSDARVRRRWSTSAVCARAPRCRCPAWPCLVVSRSRRPAFLGRYAPTADFGMAGAWQMAIEWNGQAGQESVNFQGGVQ